MFVPIRWNTHLGDKKKLTKQKNQWCTWTDLAFTHGITDKTNQRNPYRHQIHIKHSCSFYKYYKSIIYKDFFFREKREQRKVEIDILNTRKERTLKHLHFHRLERHQCQLSRHPFLKIIIMQYFSKVPKFLKFNCLIV